MHFLIKNLFATRAMKEHVAWVAIAGPESFLLENLIQPQPHTERVKVKVFKNAGSVRLSPATEAFVLEYVIQLRPTVVGVKVENTRLQERISALRVTFDFH